MQSIKFVSMIILIICTGCTKNNTEPEPQIIPLDGRGGGIIAYCYQPDSPGSVNEDIYALNADGSGNRKLIDVAIGLNYPDWSPDGERMTAIGYVSESTWSIYTFDANNINLQRLTTVTDVWDTDPSWSPDGTQIVFTRIYPSQNNRAETRIMEADGDNQQIIGVEGGSVKWSHDGTRLIYHAYKNDNYDIYTCNIDGTNEQQVTNTVTGELTPVWSPDGSQIAITVVTDTGGGFLHEIYLMNADGTNLRMLAEGANPRWSPDGLVIAFKSEGEIYIINIDGTNLRQITNSPTNINSINPVWKP